MPFHRDIRGPGLHAPTNEKVENNTGSNINRLQVIKLDGFGTLFPQVALADAIADDRFGIASTNILDTETGYVTVLGFMLNVDTSAWTPNTKLYSSATGDLSSTPFGSDNVAVVVHQDATCGVLYVNAFQEDQNAWLLVGNTGTDPNTNFWGSIDNVGITARTNNLQRMRIDENGKFSLGQATTPDAFIHIKQHSGFNGSGALIETTALTSALATFTSGYSYVVPDNCTAIFNAYIVGIEGANAERATFTRTASFFRQGANAQQEGGTQSDYTFKSDPNFNVRFSLTGSTVFIDVKNANANSTKWMIKVEINIIKHT